MQVRCVLVPTELSGADRKDCVSNHSLSSNASLPSVQSCRRLRDRRVASWAVSFERLLQDPLGVRYFSVSGAGRGTGAPPAGPWDHGGWGSSCSLTLRTKAVQGASSDWPRLSQEIAPELLLTAWAPGMRGHVPRLGVLSS